MLLFYGHDFDYDVDVCLGVLSLSLTSTLTFLLNNRPFAMSQSSLSSFRCVDECEVNFTKSLTIKQSFLRHTMMMSVGGDFNMNWGRECHKNHRRQSWIG